LSCRWHDKSNPAHDPAFSTIERSAVGLSPIIPEIQRNGETFVIRKDQGYWQRLRKDKRSNWAAGFAAVATMSATVSLIGLFVSGSQYQARGKPLYWLLMVPVVWWLSGLGQFEPRAVRWWTPVLVLSVIVTAIVLILAIDSGDWVPEAVGFGITSLSAAISFLLRRGSLVAREGPAR